MCHKAIDEQTKVRESSSCVFSGVNALTEDKPLDDIFKYITRNYTHAII